MHTFGEMLNDAGLRQYEADVGTLESLDPEQARALAIIRRLAYSSFQMSYSTERMKERFARLWNFAFPEGESGEERR
jgi:hypothetical protein